MAKKHVLCWFILHSFYIWFRVIRENVYICKFAKKGLNFVSLTKRKTLNLCYIVGRRQISRRSSKNSNAGFPILMTLRSPFSKTTSVAQLELMRRCVTGTSRKFHKKLILQFIRLFNACLLPSAPLSFRTSLVAEWKARRILSLRPTVWTVSFFSSLLV